MNFKTEAEQTLWANVLVAYLQQGGDTTKGAHLKFADRCIEGLRKRSLMGDETHQNLVDRLRKYELAYAPASEMAREIPEFVRQHPNQKIKQIKLTRSRFAPMDLMTAKAVIETVQEVCLIH